MIPLIQTTQRAFHRILRSIGSDTNQFFRKKVSYLYWNARGVRVTPEAYIHLRAHVEEGCAFFGSTRIYQRAKVDHFTYGTSCIIQNALIGKFCSLAPGCIIGPNTHPLDRISTHPMLYDAESYNKGIPNAILGHDVWVGAYAIILPGVTVPDGCVVAASAVVTSSFEPFSILGGIPAKVIGSRKSNSFANLIAGANSIQELKELATYIRSSTP